MTKPPLVIDPNILLDSRKDIDSKILEQVSEVKNYQKWLLDLILPHIKGNCLEIGCGIGTYTSFYYQKSKKLFCTDTDQSYIDFLKQYENKFVTFKNIDLSNPKAKKLSQSFDSIVSTNVFEHIKDDQQVFNNTYHLLNKQGTLIVLVPALPILYGTQDKLIGHFRRYTKTELDHKLRTAGFTDFKIQYINFFGTFGWFLQNRILKKETFSPVSLKLYDTLVPIFRRLEKIVPLPFGQSLLVIAQK